MRTSALWIAVLLLAPLGAFGGDTANASTSKDGIEVLVAARDLPAGEKVTQDDIRALRIPTKWATPSQIQPKDASYILNQQLTVAVLKGGVLLWQVFQTTRSSDKAFDDCARVTKTPKDAMGQVAAARQAVLRH